MISMQMTVVMTFVTLWSKPTSLLDSVQGGPLSPTISKCSRELSIRQASPVACKRIRARTCASLPRPASTRRRGGPPSAHACRIRPSRRRLICSWTRQPVLAEELAAKFAGGAFLHPEHVHGRHEAHDLAVLHVLRGHDRPVVSGRSGERPRMLTLAHLQPDQGF